MNNKINKYDELKKRLESESEKIKSTLLSLKSQDPFSDPDRLVDNAASDTEANEESSHERVEALEKEMTLHLEEINTVIGQINKGTYGKCLSCNKNIDSQRLEIKPTALYCMDCEIKKEK
jgi:RNA polymerase-binding transcription factor DksA